MIFGAEDGEKLTAESAKKAIENTLKEINKDDSVDSIASPFVTGTIAKDSTVAYADIKFKSSADDIKDYSIKHLKDSLKMADDAGLQTELSGDIPEPRWR